MHSAKGTSSSIKPEPGKRSVKVRTGLLVVSKLEDAPDTCCKLHATQRARGGCTFDQTTISEMLQVECAHS